jgi:hypothetical protein
MTMATRRHKQDTRTFEELDYAGQAKSITAQINILIKAINAHIQRAKDEGRKTDEMRNAVVMQIIRGICRISK